MFCADRFGASVPRACRCDKGLPGQLGDALERRPLPEISARRCLRAGGPARLAKAHPRLAPAACLLQGSWAAVRMLGLRASPGLALHAVHAVSGLACCAWSGLACSGATGSSEQKPRECAAGDEWRQGTVADCRVVNSCWCVERGVA